MPQSANKKPGFTVIEATIAISILMVGIIAISQFFPFSLRIVSDSSQVTVAATQALSKIEEIQVLEYSDLPIGVIEEKHRLSPDPQNYLYNYWRETEIQYVDQNLNDSPTDIGMKKIKTTVFWKSIIGNAEKSTEFISLKSRH